MLKVDALKLAADEFFAAALIGDGWEKALMGLAKAADAQGAVLLRDRATICEHYANAQRGRARSQLHGRPNPAQSAARCQHKLCAGWFPHRPRRLHARRVGR